MHIVCSGLILLLFLSGCFPEKYPKLTDVPEYTPPSISTTQAQKEIEELKAERATHIPQ
jgi:hypothetical protein